MSVSSSSNSVNFITVPHKSSSYVMSCEEAVSKILAIKNSSKNHVNEITKVVETYLNSNPDGRISEIELNLRQKEIIYLRKKRELDDEVCRLGKQVEHYSKIIKLLFFTNGLSTETKQQVYPYFQTYEKQLDRRSENLLKRRAAEENYQVYFFASGKRPIGSKVYSLRSSERLTPCPYTFIVNTRPRLEALTERRDHVPNAQLNFERLDVSGNVEFDLESLADYFASSESSIGDFVLNTPKGFKVILIGIKMLPKKMDERIANLLALSKQSNYSQQNISDFYKKLDETISYLNNILNFKINIVSNLVKEVKEKAAKEIENLNNLLGSLPEGLKNEAALNVSKEKLAVVLKNLNQNSLFSFDKYSTIFEICDDCFGIIKLHVESDNPAEFNQSNHSHQAIEVIDDPVEIVIDR